MAHNDNVAHNLDGTMEMIVIRLMENLRYKIPIELAF